MNVRFSDNTCEHSKINDITEIAEEFVSVSDDRRKYKIPWFFCCVNVYRDCTKISGGAHPQTPLEGMHISAGQPPWQVGKDCF